MNKPEGKVVWQGGPLRLVFLEGVNSSQSSFSFEFEGQIHTLAVEKRIVDTTGKEGWIPAPLPSAVGSASRTHIPEDLESWENEVHSPDILRVFAVALAIQAMDSPKERARR